MAVFERILGIVLPVLAVVLAGYVYARRVRPDMRATNKLTLDVLVPLLVFSALAAKDFDLLSYRWLLLGSFAIVVGSGLLAWPIARGLKADPRTFVPPMMFNNCGNMGLPLAVLAFGPDALGPAVAPKDIAFRQNLPKTRSGKIMRRLLKARELGLPEGDISTLESEER